ncbi:LysR substrate-binding domain-containing protein [Burkholderia contaminans]|uniref:LysR substrate-binding domain-containing protein n=1 Tax=Burkholderia contaminans TaxID=488447 RepID=UPI000B0F8E44|nr:LysR substrate-binding domain-containing protein [Burkholderia contaminans]MEB4632603.1 LysR substrate-binding domain-containing protein [Burkholderia contaminans]MEB4638779.1 LysR substrate-binding domain-containing protein [Burkholderia contaminans]MEB4653435.1 LysR substrate-binding domain-containing protein [Burkholderia contaminans]MEB4662361.1 LysR substrate-binding domain-containing protein [Burkholderia contaminans]MEB4668686.1 LysR substrate-binding domain-containing protein [Burkh
MNQDLRSGRGQCQGGGSADTARRAAQPSKQRFAPGFLTGQEMTWLPKALNLLRDELPDIDVTVSSDYSPDLADALARGRLDLAFLRAEPGFDLDYTTVGQEPLVVLMPSDHTLASQESIRPQQLVGQPFVAMANKARVLRSVVDTYLQREGVTLTPTQGVDNPAMVMSLVASRRGLTLIPDYVENLLPWSVVSRLLAGDAPTIDLVVGHSRSNASPILKLFLSRLSELVPAAGKQATQPRMS